MKLLISLGLSEVTTVERDALTPLVGDMLYNTDASEIQTYSGTDWKSTGNTRVENGIRAYILGGVPINSIVTFNKLSSEVILEIGAPKSKIHCLTAPTATTVIDIHKSLPPYTVSDLIGTLTWGAGQLTPSISLTTQQVLPVNTILKLTSPSDVFGMRDLYIDLIGHSALQIY
jgi:hypothetical protein